MNKNIIITILAIGALVFVYKFFNKEKNYKLVGKKLMQRRF